MQNGKVQIDLDLKQVIDSLTSEQRLELFSNYCKFCGSDILPCHCHNDD
jgi:hypothetical protein